MAQFMKIGPVEAGDIDSGSAAAGQVLTADGSGAAGWRYTPVICIPGTAQTVTAQLTPIEMTSLFFAVMGRNPAWGDRLQYAISTDGVITQEYIVPFLRVGDDWGAQEVLGEI